MSTGPTNAQLHGSKFEGWQCFHCGEIHTTVGSARDHFGADPSKEPGCLIKVKFGNERGLEMELRKVEDERDSLQHQISNESTEAHLAMQKMQGEHSLALRREEEKGYSRGLNDGRNISIEQLLKNINPVGYMDKNDSSIIRAGICHMQSEILGLTFDPSQSNWSIPVYTFPNVCTIYQKNYSRTPKDYAIEHAKYMAAAAENYLNVLNEVLTEDMDFEESSEAMTSARKNLELMIFEFRKRAARAA